ncbi:WYL domain-containing protein [Janthinobacterium lividum]|uniref:WYL domain-containing protein n=1 Tax=Janthinobacterium lividum TaxID=29581 RepID=UPI0009B8A8AF|nr:WYL domain-containing protein [Janthinobacterium lividum]
MQISSTDKSAELAQFSHNQRERLAYIEFKLYFFGRVGRQDVMDRFGVASAGATRDFAFYKELAPNNIVFDNVEKAYAIRDEFTPIFEHVPERVITALSQGFGDGINPVEGPLMPCELPPALNRIKISILAPITRAIFLGKVVAIKYFSATSGASEREIVPFALATDGLRWHVRAYDRKQERFLDFVISRVDHAGLVDSSAPQKLEQPSQDHQWNRIVELDLVPHPDRKYPEIVKRDFSMADGVLHLKVRAAMAGYILRQLHVDCSADHSLDDDVYRLWLKDPLVLYGVGSAQLAPGYKTQSAAS